MNKTFKHGAFLVAVYPNGIGGNTLPEAHLLRLGVCLLMRTELTPAKAIGRLQLWVQEYRWGQDLADATEAITLALADYGYEGVDGGGFLRKPASVYPETAEREGVS